MLELFTENLLSIVGGIVIIGLLIKGQFDEKSAEKKGYEKAKNEIRDAELKIYEQNKRTQQEIDSLSELELRQYVATGMWPRKDQ